TLSKSTAYPVPPPLQQPKHLFHLVIRYEGDGIVDSNVADLVKNISGLSAAKEESSDKEKEKDKDKAKPDAASPSAANQLFNFITLSEGEGTADPNVSSLPKALYRMQNANQAPPAAPVCPAPSVGLSSGGLPPGVLSNALSAAGIPAGYRGSEPVPSQVPPLT